MKILVVSDTHGRHSYLEEAYDKVKPVDMMIHLGDIEGAEDYIKGLIECEIKMVAGNNDYFTRIPNEDLIQVGNYKIFITHGHRYGVYFSNETIKDAARSRGANIVMFGHTHRPLIDMSGDVWVINPGSITQPRQEGRKPSFIIMEIDRYNEAHFTINYI